MLCVGCWLLRVARCVSLTVCCFGVCCSMVTSRWSLFVVRFVVLWFVSHVSVGVDWCWLVVVGCLAFRACCVSFVCVVYCVLVRCLLFVLLLLPIGCVLCVVRCVSFVGCCLMIIVCCCLFDVCCSLFVACCVLFGCVVFVVCCLVCGVWCYVLVAACCSLFVG